MSSKEGSSAWYDRSLDSILTGMAVKREVKDDSIEIPKDKVTVLEGHTSEVRDLIPEG